MDAINKKYHETSECRHIAKESLACQEQRSPRNKRNVDTDKEIDCSAIIKMYQDCKKAEREAVIAERRRQNGY
jgi:hypothetical protein